MKENAQVFNTRSREKGDFSNFLHYILAEQANPLPGPSAYSRRWGQREEMKEILGWGVFCLTNPSRLAIKVVSGGSSRYLPPSKQESCGFDLSSEQFEVPTRNTLGYGMNGPIACGGQPVLWQHPSAVSRWLGNHPIDLHRLSKN